MFGGAGLYRDGVMFAMLDDDVVYFRVDDALEADLKAQGSVPWSYSMKRDGAVRDMGYWRMPETAADDPDEAVAIAKRAFAAAIGKEGREGQGSGAKKPATKAGERKSSASKALRGQGQRNERCSLAVGRRLFRGQVGRRGQRSLAAISDSAEAACRICGVGGAGQDAAPDGAVHRRGADTRGGDARRLFRDLDGASAACGRRDWCRWRSIRAMPRSRRGTSRGRDWRRRVEIIVGPAMQSLPHLSGPVRPRLHRCRQGKQRGVFRPCRAAVAPGRDHHRGQCRARRML